ncbi:RNA-binding protein NOB1 [Auxenochlorella protothecoides]|uniref:RNA-binding protein NOB1 n=1 Tax=Auxenochlorella protothecoides TaxID=3075 RepID=A0A087SBU5_AUXPR|nr:RNA-binding protein NOB1 [Auxenochlorella protothecoides]KFM23199.1 RNA-binding protein NOB1 [Auxenochlorella protothecoides]
MSWASIAKKAAPAIPSTDIGPDESVDVAVLDANAIISGQGLLLLAKLANRAVTTPEVLAEVRDKKSRATLEALPYTLEATEPAEEDVKAVLRFARATGDAHALSSADVRLIALTRMLEIARHGPRRVRDLPPPLKIVSRRVKETRTLPGWGEGGENWAEMERLNAAEEAAEQEALAAAAGTGSHVAAQMQALALEERETADGDTEAARAARALAEAAVAAGSSSGGDDSSDDDGDREDAEEGDQSGDDAGPSPAAASSVCVLTADFAMQNVILQMGLRLVTPDNRRVTRLSRWVLRCGACFQVSKEVGRVFCARCGNAAMERVHVSVSPEGVEQYGVRKRHVLRGTRFALPKPRGGRAKDVILAEDVLMQRTGKARRRAARKAEGEVDPFAAEYTTDTWHQAAGLGAMADKGAAALLAGWKHNPNERKHVATNRRRK